MGSLEFSFSAQLEDLGEALRVVVDPDGLVEECDESDNEGTWLVDACE